MRICQLQNISKLFFIATFFTSCSTPDVQIEHDDPLIEANWQKVPPKFSHRDHDFKRLTPDEKILTHPFYDIDPSFKKERRLVNVFTTVPESGAYKYNFDLYSGRLYKDHDYCQVDDVLGQYSGNLNRPNFTQAIVPRFLNELNNPQAIIIFSDSAEKVTFKLQPTSYSSVRIIGSVLQDVCENYPCDENSKWLTSQILVGVNPYSVPYKAIHSLSELKTQVDWKYAIAILTNQEGVHQLGNKLHPAFLISKELNLEETFDYFEKKAKAVKLAEVKSFREECFKLYDEIWDKSEGIRSEKENQQTKFLTYFKEFYDVSSEKFYQCQKLFRPASINENEKRLWFFTFLQAFINLERNDFYYSCLEKAWLYNPKVDGTHHVYDQKTELKKCKARNFEKAFDQSINGLALMKNQINRTYRFIEYDTQRGGSHQKIFGWIERNNKSYVCKNQKNKTREDSFELFPQDVVWPNYESDIADNDITIK
jgi:hypothetical protein